MNKTTTVSALFLAGAMLVSSIEVRADAVPAFDTRAKFIIAAAGTIFAGWASLYARKSEKEFKTRYSPEQTRKVSKILTTDYMKNAWYYVADEIIGQRKTSSVLKVKADGKIYPSEDAPAYGLLGNVDAYAAPLAESAKKFTEPLFQAGALWFFIKNFAQNPSVETATKAPRA